MAPQDRESGRPILPMRSSSTIRRTHRLALNLNRHERARNRLTTRTRQGEWGNLDGKIWAPNEGRGGDDDEQQVDGVERFFDYLAYQF